jgi:hypothetical protein
MAWTADNLASLEEAVTSPYQISLLRISLLKEDNGFAAVFVPLLKNALDSWLLSFEKLPNLEEEEKKEEEMIQSEPLINELIETSTLRRVLQVHVAISRLDKSLGEELGRQGSHVVLSRLMRYDGSLWEREEDQDTIMEFQDLACEIATSGAFPLKVAPFSIDDLKCRLPIQFDIHPVDASSDGPSVNDAKLESQLVLINQVTERQSAQVDVGFGTSSQAFLWQPRVLYLVCLNNVLIIFLLHLSHLAVGCRIISVASLESTCSARTYRIGIGCWMRSYRARGCRSFALKGGAFRF